MAAGLSDHVWSVQEWLAFPVRITNVGHLTMSADLYILEGKASARKLRLLTVAIARSLWEFMPAQLARQAVELGARVADDDDLEGDRRLMVHRLRAIPIDYYKVMGANWLSSLSAHQCAAYNAALLTVAKFDGPYKLTNRISWQSLTECIGDQQHFIDDILGCCDGPIAINNNWIVSDVVRFAKRMYVDDQFDNMQSLGMRLQLAGCDNDSVLNHCLSSRNHARGCWVVDLILDRK